jgi:hypothetical protein
MYGAVYMMSGILIGAGLIGSTNPNPQGWPVAIIFGFIAAILTFLVEINQ